MQKKFMNDLIQKFEIVAAPKERIIFKQNDIGSKFYIIVAGTV